LYYRAFEIITTLILICTSTLVYVFSDAIISIFLKTTEVPITAELQKLMWVFSLNTFPDCYKGMLKGVIKALGIQSKAAYINISGHWCINITLQLYLGFHLKMGLKGIWIAKVVNEFYIFAAYIIVLRITDWDEKAKIAMER
jgi:MATE family multidrug resistance protein